MCATTIKCTRIVLQDADSTLSQPNLWDVSQMGGWITRPIGPLGDMCWRSSQCRTHPKPTRDTKMNDRHTATASISSPAGAIIEGVVVHVLTPLPQKKSLECGITSQQKSTFFLDANF